MKKGQRILLMIGLALVIFAVSFVIIRGDTYTIGIDTLGASADPDEYGVTIEQEREIIRLTDKRAEDGMLKIDIRSVSPGRTFLSVLLDDDYYYSNSIYVHRLGTITVGGYMGNSSGDFIIPVLVSIYILLMMAYVVIQYRRDMKKCLYRYRNIRHLGIFIFLCFAFLTQFVYIFSESSLADSVKNVLNSASHVAYVAFPIAFAVSILISVSNIQLIKKEGRSRKNMLGLMLGLLLCVSTIFPSLLSEYLQRTTLVDVHNEQGWALYAEMAVTNVILVAVSYLECILWATVILSFKASRRTPSFDRNFILILGCKIKDDGSLTPLLQGRADNAIDFANKQKAATGKDIIFVPSGGQGSDEIMPEGRAIRDYLISKGIPEERILTEDRSVNTYENFKYSLELIEKEFPGEDVKVAFSTTNYHVFRSGVVAEELGCHAEGTGSKTKGYFGINAFIREFIATVYAEWKNHLTALIVLMLWVLALVMTVRMSNAIY